MPQIVSILVGETPEAVAYVRNQSRGAHKAGLPFRAESRPADIAQEEYKRCNTKMNDDEVVLGIK